MSRFSGDISETSFPTISLPFHRPRKVLSIDLPEAVPSSSKWDAYLERVNNPQEPGDFLEVALLAWKPGTRTGREVAESALILAGILPPIPDGDLLTIAQDLVDNDPRLEGEK